MAGVSMNRTVLFAGILLAVGIGPGVAADLLVEAPLYAPPPPNWTGFYVGANAGYAWGHSDASTTAEWRRSLARQAP
jgi:outer membrane immunogenic protein